MNSSWYSVFRVAPVFIAIGIVFNPCNSRAQRPLGTDVSGYQAADLPWATAKANGVRFAWTKCTEGTGYVNPNFIGQVTGATNAGVYIGLYHYARPGLHPNITGANSADSEAAYFWSHASPYIKYGGAYFMPMLDWEDVGTSGQPTTEPSIANGFTAAQMSAWLNEWCTAVSNSAFASGVIIKPVVYSGSWYSAPGSTWPGLDSSVTYHPNTMSGYPLNPNPQTGAPSSTSPWPSWTFWQYADTNWTGGDSDVYNGTLTTLIQNYVIGGTNAPVITLQPTNFTLNPGGAATFSVRATGKTPLAYQWYFNGAIIAGATSSNYAVANVDLGDVGGYVATVANSYASLSSKAGYLTILSNPPAAVVAPSGLVDWWPAEGTPIDLIGTAHGALVNPVTYVTGKEGRAFRFNGTNSYITTGATSIPVPWTASFWVNRQNSPGTGAALCSDGAGELKLEQYNGTRQVGFTKFTYWDQNFGYSVPLNAWTHLVFVASGNQMQLYANGALAGTIATNMPLPRAYFGMGYVSSNGNMVDYLLASIDEIMLFNRALNAGEVSSLYAAGNAGYVHVSEFTAVQSLGNNQIQLNLKGLTGKTFSIYRSLDFTTWTKLGTVANPTGTILYMDNSATNDQSFYRASQP
jgi:GH25 family lysozyme M1 (1,4-beta-N-acetylmuramidase)